MTDFERFLESHYNRTLKQDILCFQIEKLHEDPELQEDGTYVKDPVAAAVRNAELDYLAKIEEEKERQAEMEYLLGLEKQEERERQERARRRSYGHLR